MKHAAAASTTTRSRGTPAFHKSAGLAHAPDASSSRDPQRQFMMAALSMSWQLAIVVLVPLLTGNWLDHRLHSQPLWTGVGFLMALGGMALVVWRHLQLYSPGKEPKS